MNTDTPSPSAEEGAVSAPFEKLPKLNLPPKPVLATEAAAVAPPVPAPAPATKPLSEPPPMVQVSPPAPAPVVPPAKKTEVTEAPAPNKKRATLSMPLAMIAFVVALLGLIVQLLSFLHLF